MPDIFISYSRHDTDFVRRLQDALIRQNRDVWVDSKDIPPTADWLQEIYAAIESSHALVFVLSPDSLASEICQIELTHAVGHNKRLVPVVYREVDPGSVNEALAKLNWIFLRDGDNFDAGLETLVEALDTELDYVRSHTRLLTRAIEWNSRERNSSYLLRGDDLRDAEAWLSQNAGQKPQATSLQIAYIDASRRSAVRRKRVSIGLLMGFLIVAAVLGYWGIESQRGHLAELSGRLAEQSLSQLSNRLDLALLLAMEAYDTKPTEDTRRSLLAALQYSPHLITSLHGHDAPVHTVAFRADGVLFSMDKEGNIMQWDTDTYRRVGRFAAGGNDGFASGSLSSIGSIMALGGEDGSITLWDAAGNKMLGRFPERHGRRVRSLSFSPDGLTLASGSEDYTVVLWDVRSLKKTGGPYELSSGVASLAFNPGTNQLAASGYDGIVNLFEFNPRAQTLGNSSALLNHRFSVWCTAFSRDGRRLASGDLEGNIIIWDTATGKPVGEPLAGRETELLSLAFSPDGKRLASGGSDGSIVLWDTTQDKVDPMSLTGYKYEPRQSLTGFQCNLPGQCGVASLDFRPDGKILASAIGNTVVLWSLEPRESLQTHLVEEARPDGISFSADGRIMALLDYEGKVTLRDGVKRQVIAGPFQNESRLVCQTLSPDGRTLAAGSEAGDIVVWDIASRHAQLLRAPSATGAMMNEVTQLAFSPDGKLLAALSTKATDADNKLRLWDVKAAAERWHSQAPKGWPESLSFSRDGSKLALVSGRNLVVWNAATAEKTKASNGFQTKGVSRIAIAPDYQTVAMAGVDGRILLRHPGTDTVIAEFPNPGYEANSGIAFSSDDMTLASTGCAKWEIFPIKGQRVCVQDEIRIWDVRTRRNIGRLMEDRAMFTDFIQTLAFRPDGDLLVSIRDSGKVTLWDLDPRSWQRIACRLANRNLSKEEQDRYLENRRYHAKCLAEPE